MDTGPHRTPKAVFRARGGVVLPLLAAGPAVVALAGTLTGALTGTPAGGDAAQVLAGWPLLVPAYAGWWLFRYPYVAVDDDGVTLRNPVRTIQVPWPALVDVDTRFALTLVTPQGRWSAWAAPAPGIMATHAGRREDVNGLPDISYGPARSIRPGDLRSSDSGAAALLVRSRWVDLVEGGLVAVDPHARARFRFNWYAAGTAAFGSVAAVLQLFLGS